VVIVGRGQVIADTSVADLLASVSGARVMLRTAAGTQAAAVLERAGATAAVTGPDALMVSGLPAERVVALLSESSVPFAEVTAHRATLEQAYMELTKGAVEFQSGGPPAGRAGGVMTTITPSRPTAPPAGGRLREPAARRVESSSGLFAAGSSPSSSRCW